MYKSVETELQVLATSFKIPRMHTKNVLLACHADAVRLYPDASWCVQRRTAEFNAWTALVHLGCPFPGSSPREEELEKALKKAEEISGKAEGLEERCGFAVGELAEERIRIRLDQTSDVKAAAIMQELHDATARNIDLKVLIKLLSSYLRKTLDALSATRAELKSKEMLYNTLVQDSDATTQDLTIEKATLESRVSALEQENKDLVAKVNVHLEVDLPVFEHSKDSKRKRGEAMKAVDE